MFHWLVLCSLLTFIQSASFSPNIDQSLGNNLIVGGFPIDISLIPYQVSVQFLWRHYCGGTLISPAHVITAAHCIVSNYPKVFSIRIGSNHSADGGIINSVKQIIGHPCYNSSTIEYDITVIVLNESQTWTRNFPKLPAPMTQFNDGAIATISGWGDTNNPAESDDVLRAANVPIVNHDLCKTLYKGKVTDLMLCAGFVDEGGVDSCQGDSGGPLVLNGTLIGVVSWGRGCARKRYPGVYTSVSSVVLWIAKTIGI